MKIQLNTDVHIEGTEALAAQVSATVERAVHGGTLGRLNEHRDQAPGPGMSGTAAPEQR